MFRSHPPDSTNTNKDPFSVFHYYFDKADKLKFLILVSEDPSAYVVINTSIPNFYIGKPEEMLNILLPLSEHNFFDRDSRANCNEVHFANFNHNRQRNERGFVGYIHDNCREEIIKALNNSRNINKFTKDKINEFCTRHRATPPGL